MLRGKARQGTITRIALHSIFPTSILLSLSLPSSIAPIATALSPFLIHVGSARRQPVGPRTFPSGGASLTHLLHFIFGKLLR